jgi:Domain of unknown function (DUF6265)
VRNQLLPISGILLLCAGAWAQEPDSQMSKLAWIAGCWKGGETTQTEEQWTKLTAGSMFGVGRTIRDGKTVSFEFMQIREKGPDILYIAQPEGAPAVPFKLVKLNNMEAIFENDQHDFPQRIAYQRQIDGSLLAAIEGVNSGKAKRIEFPMKRVRCD